MRAFFARRASPIRRTIVGKVGGRRAAVEEPPALAAQLGVECGKPIAQRAERVWIVERRRDVGESPGERLPASLVQAVAGRVLDRRPRALAEVRIVEAASA
jgi:hypothetical protein